MLNPRLHAFMRLSAALCLGFALNAQTEAVSDWNLITIQTITAGGRPPGGSPFLDTATVHLAVHDAVAALDGQFTPYAVTMLGASGSPVAAVAKAAYDVLMNRFPAQSASLTTTYNNYLASHGLNQNNPGVAVGQRAAAGIIALRSNDGSYPSSDPPVMGGNAPGQWRPTPPALAPMATPWLATVRPFALMRPSQFRADPPPSLTSTLYARDFNEVKEFGSTMSSRRTQEQTELAYFWSGNFLVMLNGALRGIATTRALDIGKSARLFALANMAMADSVITSWDTKLHYLYWRPITAVQNASDDGDPRTTSDPSWEPLIATPPYPDYTSGANNVTGAATRILRSFFDTNNLTITVTTTVPLAQQQTRTYRSIPDLADDVVVARIYEGIHYAFADIEARKQGESVADWVFRRLLRPVANAAAR